MVKNPLPSSGATGAHALTLPLVETSIAKPAVQPCPEKSPNELMLGEVSVFVPVFIDEGNLVHGSAPP